MARRSRRAPKTSKPSRIRGLVLRLTAVGFLLAIAYGGYLAWTATSEFEGRRWDIPAQVYAAPLELYAGRALSAEDLVAELKRLGLPRRPAPHRARHVSRRASAAWSSRRAAFRSPATRSPSSSSRSRSSAAASRRCATRAAARAAIVRLNPLLIGSLFPSHGEDRLIVAPGDIPPLLTDTLKAVEDRRFDSHFGVDPIAVVRALFVNVSAGEIREGASTLTQQLVRSYFLTNERTLRAWWRKLREAFMAVALELRYGKSELLHAYVNEIYLGQDGARAIHGFGLASQFYFGKPLAELELHELALLVAVVRGPTYYDPRRHADRALERRNFVLQRMADEGLASNDAVQAGRRARPRPRRQRPPQHDALGVLGARAPAALRRLRARRSRAHGPRRAVDARPRRAGGGRARAERRHRRARQERRRIRRRRRRHEPAHGRGEGARRRPRRELTKASTARSTRAGRSAR